MVRLIYFIYKRKAFYAVLILFLVLPLTISFAMNQTNTRSHAASSTALNLIVCPHGIGDCGDNVAPNTLGNTSPKHPTRTVSLSFINSSNISVATVSGTVTYSSTSQDFQGTISTPTLSSGQYIILLQMNGYLQKQLPGIITITQGKAITLPEIWLVAGDINNDNKLNIIDYQTLMSCFGDKASSSVCSAHITAESFGADIDDNGVVDGSDYNLFIRELSAQNGPGGESPTPSTSVGTNITIDGTKTGPAFDGIGAISGGGGNSRLLIDYPDPERSQILDYLFKPNYGASLQLLKLEIGGDSNTSDGSEASIEHTRGIIACDAGYEWWLAEQAKQRNPNIQLYGLQWGAPGWVNTTNTIWTQNDVNYVIDWLNCAKSHGLTINYLGGWNEKGYNTSWYDEMRSALNNNGYANVKIVADDGFNDKWNFANTMVTDPVFNAAVSILGEHDTCAYPTLGYQCQATTTARSLGKPLWESEIGAMDANTGAVDMVRSINNSYNQAGVTGLLEWPLIDSMAPDLAFENRGLITADQPWSGNYIVDLMTWGIAQTTQFVQPGWLHVGGANKSLGNSGTYNTYQTPDHSAWTMVAENTGASASQIVSPQTIQVTVTGGLPSAVVHVWATNLQSVDPSQWFTQLPDITLSNNTFQYTIQPGYVVTFTTTSGQTKGTISTIPSATTMPLSYTASPDESNEPIYLNPQDGAFEYEPCQGRIQGNCIEQMASQLPILWLIASNGQTRVPYAIVGDNSWKNYTISSNILFLHSGSTAGLIGRFNTQAGNGNRQQFDGYEFILNDTGAWYLYKNTAVSGRTILKKGSIGNIGKNTWHKISLSLQNNTLSAQIDNKPVTSTNDGSYTFGLAGIESNWMNIQFTNLQVK